MPTDAPRQSAGVTVMHLDDIMVRVRNDAKARAHTVLVASMGALLVLAPFIASFARGPLRDDAAAAIIVPSSMAGEGPERTEG